jgi:hypothetical protein
MRRSINESIEQLKNLNVFDMHLKNGLRVPVQNYVKLNGLIKKFISLSGQ